MAVYLNSNPAYRYSCSNKLSFSGKELHQNLNANECEQNPALNHTITNSLKSQALYNLSFNGKNNWQIIDKALQERYLLKIFCSDKFTEFLIKQGFSPDISKTVTLNLEKEYATSLEGCTESLKGKYFDDDETTAVLKFIDAIVPIKKETDRIFIDRLLQSLKVDRDKNIISDGDINQSLKFALGNIHLISSESVQDFWQREKFLEEHGVIFSKKEINILSDYAKTVQLINQKYPKLESFSEKIESGDSHYLEKYFKNEQIKDLDDPTINFAINYSLELRELLKRKIQEAIELSK